MSQGKGLGYIHGEDKEQKPALDLHVYLSVTVNAKTSHSDYCIFEEETVF